MRWEEKLDWVEVSAVGTKAEALLSDFKGKSALRKLTAIPGGWKGWVPARKLETLVIAAQQRQVELSCTDRKGPGRILEKYRLRVGIPLGITLFCAILNCTENMVWTVKHINFTEEKRTILNEILQEEQLFPGDRAEPVKLRRAEQRLMSEYPDFGWVTLNFTERRLTAECIEAQNAPQLSEEGSQNLVAAEDGIIVAQNVRSGFLQKRAGDAVTKGELLVSSTKLDHLERPVTRPVAGEIIARFEVEMTEIQPMRYTAFVPVGVGQRSVQLAVFGRTFCVNGVPLPENDAKIKHRGLTCLGLPLPATVIEIEVPNQQEAVISLTVTQAIQQARYRCLCRLQEQYPEAAILEEYQEENLTENGLELYWKAVVEANIAVPESCCGSDDTDKG